jgi:hypothetical protein
MEAEFKATDEINLKRLRIKTQSDYEKYTAEFDKGGLIYFTNDDKFNAFSLQRFNFENIPLLRERIRLEYIKSDLKGKLYLFEAIIERIQNEALPPQPDEKRKDTKETPKTFEELFYNADLVTPCIDILKELDPPLIDTDCNYIGKLKGVFCVWIDEMQKQGIVKSNYPEERKLFASLIPTKIKRFSIDESMFGKHQDRAEKQYRTDIKTKVSKIKLSQNSH